MASPGDVSAPDGVVDVHDLLKTLSGYDKENEGIHPGPDVDHVHNFLSASSNCCLAADIDKNHAVDVEDLLYVLKHYDEVCARQKQPAGEIPDKSVQSRFPSVIAICRVLWVVLIFMLFLFWYRPTKKRQLHQRSSVE